MDKDYMDLEDEAVLKEQENAEQDEDDDDDYEYDWQKRADLN